MVENKIDLVDDKDKDINELKTFAEENDFCGFYQSSAKTGFNVKESMDFLTKTIIEKWKEIESKEMNSNRNSVALEPENHKDIEKLREKDSGCC